MVRSLNAPYGAFELKRTYQKNMIMGTSFSALLTALIIVSIWLYNVINHRIPEPVNIIRIRTIADLGAPPSVQTRPPQVNIEKPRVAAPNIGIPEPAREDEIVDENIMIASRKELQDINTPVISENGGSGGSQIVIDIPADEYMPPSDTFIPVEKYPVLVHEEIPEYPRLARDGGFAGWVIVEAYVDRDGNVRKAHAVKTNRPNMGFEEAAEKAELKCKYRPGIQNGNPIGVWVTHTYRFTLDK